MIPASITSFGEWIALRRKTLDLTQRELAARANCALATIKKIEMDERRPSRDLAEALAGALQIPDGARERFVECARGLRPVDTLPLSSSDLPRQRSAVLSSGETDLPASASPLVGRAGELAQIADLLAQPTCRLLTLTGVGGAGKTRLALEAARAQRFRFADGVAYVPLAAVTDAALVPQSLALSLSLGSSGSADGQLVAYLRDKTILLVLDNCEQLVRGESEGGADQESLGWLSGLLASAPGVKLLATSREPLQLTEEWNYRVPAMSDAQALALFEQTARRFNPDFPNVPQAADAAAVCRLVENLPLAIELAASWTPFMSCEQIAAHIRQDIDFLSANVRNVPGRHRSMRAVFDHSWRLLSPAEQEALMQLSVFRGGWTLDEAESVAGASVFILRTLGEKSLIRSADGERHDMHELIRQYAADHLSAAGLEGETRRRHAGVYLALTSRLASQLYGAAGIHAYARLDQERDNLRAAMTWALDDGQVEIVRQFVDKLYLYWQRRGFWAEGEHWTAAALEREGEGDSPLLCWTLVSASVFTALQGRYLEAQKYLRAFPMAQRLGDPESMLRVLLVLGQAMGDHDEAAAAFEQIFAIAKTVDQLSNGTDSRSAFLASAHVLYGDQLRLAGRMEAAEAQYRESLALYRQIGNVDMIAYPIGNLGRLALQEGRVDEAHTRFGESVAISRAVGNHVGIADWLLQLGTTNLLLGDLAQAEACLEEALALYQEMSNQRGSQDVLAKLGCAALLKRDHAAAQAHTHECLSLIASFTTSTLGDFMRSRWSVELRQGMLLCIQVSTLLSADNGAVERAVTLAGAASSLEANLTSRIDFGLQRRIDAALETIRSRLSSDAYAAAWELGAALSSDTVLDYLLHP